MKFSSLVPTRGRPDSMTRYVRSVFNTARDPSTIEVIFYIDNDDLPSKDRAEELKEKYNIKYVFGDRIILSQTINECYKLAEGDILFLGSDDLIVRTQDWDKIVLNAYNQIEDKIALVYGHDGHSPTCFATHPFLHRAWVDVVGYVTPPYFVSGMADKWLNNVAKKINRHIFTNILTQHVNPDVKRVYSYKSNLKNTDIKKYKTLLKDIERNKDKTYDELAYAGHTINCKEIYDILKPERSQNIKDLLDAIQHFQQTKVNNFVDTVSDKYDIISVKEFNDYNKQ
jgi:hypothetical protein